MLAVRMRELGPYPIPLPEGEREYGGVVLVGRTSGFAPHPIPLSAEERRNGAWFCFHFDRLSVAPSPHPFPRGERGSMTEALVHYD